VFHIILALKKEFTTGILLQGDIRNWTIPVIEEYQQNFPNSEIVLSTWNDEDISRIPCRVIQSKIPEPTYPYTSTKNFQIIGSQSGLKTMKSDIILKIRTDMFVHNSNIFNIFFQEHSLDKIMYSHSGFPKEFGDYWISDFVQLSSRKTLVNYWDNMKLDDGSISTSVLPVESHLTKYYVCNIQNDNRPWNVVHDEYFIRKRYYEDFQMEFEKFVYRESYQDDIMRASSGADMHSESVILPGEL
jgi:hypothetical protein